MTSRTFHKFVQESYTMRQAGFVISLWKSCSMRQAVLYIISLSKIWHILPSRTYDIISSNILRSVPSRLVILSNILHNVPSMSCHVLKKNLTFIWVQPPWTRDLHYLSTITVHGEGGAKVQKKRRLASSSFEPPIHRLLWQLHDASHDCLVVGQHTSNSLKIWQILLGTLVFWTILLQLLMRPSLSPTVRVGQSQRHMHQQLACA